MCFACDVLLVSDDNSHNVRMFECGGFECFLHYDRERERGRASYAIGENTRTYSPVAFNAIFVSVIISTYIKFLTIFT